MKILIHSNAPWVPSGYGKQAAHLGRMLINLGHSVSYSAFSGLTGQPITWQVPGTSVSVAVYPAGQLPFGVDVIAKHAQTSQCDILITLMDQYMLLSATDELRALPIPFISLFVTDCTAQNGGPGMADQMFIKRSGVLPVGISHFGQERLNGYGPSEWRIPYLPHAVDTSIYKPVDKETLRADLGTYDDFIVGIAAANRDSTRKGFPEQFAAFSKFARKHSDVRLALFTVHDSRGGLRLDEMASDFGILDKCMFMPSYEQDTGLLSDDFTSQWYNSIDILSNCGYGEGFGVPIVEAQACGTPVVGTDCSTMTELIRPTGWLVQGQRFWNVVHRAWWTRPSEEGIVKAWEKAYNEGPSDDRKARSVAWAQNYSLENTQPLVASLIEDVKAYREVISTTP